MQTTKSPHSTESNGRRRVGRTFAIGVVILAGGLIAAACGSSSPSATKTSNTHSTSKSGTTTTTAQPNASSTTTTTNSTAGSTTTTVASGSSTKTTTAVKSTTTTTAKAASTPGGSLSANPTSSPSASLTGIGASSIQPFYGKLLYQYNKLNPGVTVNFTGSGSGPGVTAIEQNTASFGQSEVSMTAAQLSASAELS